MFMDTMEDMNDDDELNRTFEFKELFDFNEFKKKIKEGSSEVGNK